LSTIHRPTVTPAPRAAIVKTCSIDWRCGDERTSLVWCEIVAETRA
jgi:hypothetical protein